MKHLSKALLAEIRKAAAEAPRMYFAPLIGAVRGIWSEYRAMGLARRHETERRRARASKANER